MRLVALLAFTLSASLPACSFDATAADEAIPPRGTPTIEDSPTDAARNDTAVPTTAVECRLVPAALRGASLTPFEDGELERYVSAVTARCVPPPRASTTNDNAGAVPPVVGAAAAAQESTQPASDGESNETITNNQEVGVDEGDIVKNIGDALIVLRQGRLYAIDVAVAGAPRMTDSQRVAATDKLNSGVWYDELLVHGDLIYVIGYRYNALSTAQADGVSFSGPSGATEIDVFRLGAGKLARVGQSFIESWDYYSGNNYASRLIDGTLVFYMPISATRGERLSSDKTHYSRVLSIPRVLRYDTKSELFEVVGPLFSERDVQRPLAPVQQPTFHSIVRCSLASTGSLDCKTKAVLGGYNRQFYVSATRVYLWGDTHVFALGLGAWSVAAHAVRGQPASQLAFKELGDTLHVATTSDRTLSMLSLPLSAFDALGKQDVQQRSATLASGFGPGYAVAERFVGSTYVASFETFGGTPSRQRVFYDVLRGGASYVQEVSASYQRVEPLGSGRALLVGKTPAPDDALTLEVWTLTHKPTLQSSSSLPGLAQGETRSHGFFYKPLDGDRGTFGLPVLNQTTDTSYWYARGISNIAFYDVSTSHQLTSLGAVSSSDGSTRCETSCVDWYGNTRPIFLRDRTFSLMGSELSEVTVRPMATVRGVPATLTF